jgi:hypothetical protein
LVDSLFFCAKEGNTLDMNAKSFFIRFAGLTVIAALGWVAFAIAVHGMIMIGMTASEEDGSFGTVLAHRTAIIWMGAIVLGFISLFIKDSWRNALYFAPLYAPPVFVIFQTIL